jgi:MFS family permease
MSFADHAILWLHIAAAVFTIGPGTAAIHSTPRFVRNRNTAVVGYLFRTTRLYSIAAVLTLIFGLILAGMTHKFSQWWISVSLTLFVVAAVLLVLIVRDQRKALTALESAERAEAEQAGALANAAVAVPSEKAAHPDEEDEKAEPSENDTPAATAPASTIGRDLRVAAVERGRIAMLGGVTSLIWLVILVLMIWR